MIENREPNSSKNIFSRPQPEKGMFKTRKELIPAYHLASGKVDVFDSDTVTPLIRVEPHIEDGPLRILNGTINVKPDISRARQQSEKIVSGLPSVHMVVDRSLQFHLGNQVVAAVTSRGFRINEDYFTDHPEIKQVEFIEPQKPGEMYEFRLESQGDRIGSVSVDHKTSISFLFKTNDFLMLNHLMVGAVVRSYGDYETLRSVVDLKMDVKMANGSDDLDGEGLSTASPISVDDGTGGVLV